MRLFAFPFCNSLLGAKMQQRDAWVEVREAQRNSKELIRQQIVVVMSGAASFRYLGLLHVLHAHTHTHACTHAHTGITRVKNQQAKTVTTLGQLNQIN